MSFSGTGAWLRSDHEQLEMNRFSKIIIVGVVAVAVTYLLSGDHRVVASVIVAALCLAFVTRGTLSVQSAILCPARSTVPGQCVALTYDDGPDPETTPALLDLLRDRGAKATFFLIGDRVREHPDLARRIVDEGHAIGNHSQAHGLWTNFYSPARLRRELEACQDTIEEATGVRPALYRPPFGLVNHAVQPTIRALDLELLGWTVRSWDTIGWSVERITKRIGRRLSARDIVLLHDGGQDRERVLALTSNLIALAEGKNLELVTAPDSKHDREEQ